MVHKTKNLKISVLRYSLAFKGAGGSEFDFHFFIVSDRGECQLPGTIFGMKKCGSKRKKNIQLHCVPMRAQT